MTNLIPKLSDSSSKLIELAEKVPPLTNPATPVLSPSQLQSIQSLSAQLLSDPPNAASPSGTILFFPGSDNTAKAAAAQTLAAQLHCELYRVNLNTLLTREVADTGNALTELLHAAAFKGAILFFDEADALFGKRTGVQDSHDRFAGLSAGSQGEGSHLLQVLRQYPGIFILAVSSTETWSADLLSRAHATLKFPPTP